jgi:ketosteroid isomerase-like protein
MAQSTSTEQVQRVREGYEAFGRGDLDAIRDQFNPDVIWHVGGKHQLSGDYKGIDDVFGFFGKLFTETNGSFKNEVHDILASDDHSVVILSQTAERNGKKLTSNSVQVIHRDDEGRIKESWFLADDPYAIDDFWA